MLTVRLTVKSPRRILVVEDDPGIRESLGEVLEDLGFEVACASNGAEALARLAVERPPDLIVLDLMMPVMDGWTFRACQRSDPRLAAVPVIVVSASDARASSRAAVLAGDAFLAKPFELDRFVEEVHRLC